MLSRGAPATCGGLGAVGAAALGLAARAATPLAATRAAPARAGCPGGPDPRDAVRRRSSPGSLGDVASVLLSTNSFLNSESNRKPQLARLALKLKRTQDAKTDTDVRNAQKAQCY